jgi:8-oxo-dGTP pyrophosphatase MutT (NUDIX family)
MVLLDQRQGLHRAGEFAFRGGHVEYMEAFEPCARRKTQAERGIEIGNIRFRRAETRRPYLAISGVEMRDSSGSGASSIRPLGVVRRQSPAATPV